MCKTIAPSYAWLALLVGCTSTDGDGSSAPSSVAAQNPAQAVSAEPVSTEPVSTEPVKVGQAPQGSSADGEAVTPIATPANPAAPAGNEALTAAAPPNGGAPAVPPPPIHPSSGGAPRDASTAAPSLDAGQGAVLEAPPTAGSGPPDASAPVQEAPGGFRKQWTCPDPATLPEAMAGERLTVCEDFDFEYGFTEGPTWIASENAFFFSNFAQGNGRTGNIIKYNFMGDCELWLEDAGTNGLAVHANGNLIGASHLNRAVMEYDLVTKEQKVLADAFMDDHLDAPNDLVAHSNGTIYFTNPTHENSGRPGGFGKAVFRIDPMGEVSLIEKTGGQPNGIALSPDERQLHVVKASGWELDAEGVPTNKSGGGHSGDGISVDCAGNVRAIAINSAFGGPDGSWLFVVTKGQPPHMVKYNLPGLP